MSTAPKNQDALIAGHRPTSTTRQPRAGEQLWRLTHDGAVLVCELLDNERAGAGYEVRLRQDDDLVLGRQCETRRIALDVAEAFRQDHLRTGWLVTVA
jgi:hypothetical protein